MGKPFVSVICLLCWDGLWWLIVDEKVCYHGKLTGIGKLGKGDKNWTAMRAGSVLEEEEEMHREMDSVWTMVLNCGCGRSCGFVKIPDIAENCGKMRLMRPQLRLRTAI
ncbi:hypothetical protein E2542_SST30296 [Spatholobus suberectus]|nr:hypothetical protein E2542_SST30296 [Spatholobus suberectus]